MVKQLLTDPDILSLVGQIRVLKATSITETMEQAVVEVLSRQPQVPSWDQYALRAKRSVVDALRYLVRDIDEL